MAGFVSKLLGLCKHRWVIKKTYVRHVVRHQVSPGLIDSAATAYWADEVVVLVQCARCTKVKVYVK